MPRYKQKGDAIRKAFNDKLKNNPHIVNIRHLGLMIGIELDQPCGELVTRALEAGLLINVTQEKVIRLLPPLIIDATQINQLVDTLSALIQELTA
ncbi:MAG: acetylornithine/N-succinyldiaminopimelate aminotransferase [Pseudomonadota bacterium]|nr:acetylornithine/N-succinyldiaminopimelate aminotransferase [Pseudomonadota bacterium]